MAGSPRIFSRVSAQPHIKQMLRQRYEQQTGLAKDGAGLAAVNAAFRAAFGGGLTASIDRHCARRLDEKLGRGGETPLNRTEKHSGSHGHHSAGRTSRHKDAQDGRAARKNKYAVPLTTEAPYKPDAGNRPVRLCVQRRLACSAGDRPAGAKVRGPVVWIAGWRETKTLKPIDKVSLGEITSHRAVTTVNAQVASKVSGSEGRACN